VFRRRRWNIGTLPVSDINPFTDTIARKVEWLPASSEWEVAADCFISVTRGREIILGELMQRAEGRGVIAAWEHRGARWELMGIAIQEAGVHLSYPFLFTFQEHIYCVPERAEGGPPVLYRAIEFPLRWRRIGELLSESTAIDPTIFEFDGRWWLAHTDPGDRQARLMMWHSRLPFGPWEPHCGNPVKRDPGSARGAGTPFIWKGDLIRPAQDCSLNYGSRIVFNRVCELTPHTFREEPVGTLAPDLKGPYPHGLHTISISGGLAAIDGSRYVCDPRAWLYARRQRRARHIQG